MTVSDPAVVSAIAALVAALGGATIGAWWTTRLERRREKRQGLALRYAIRTDVVRWMNVCSWAAEGRATGHPGDALRWPQIAGELALHVPIGLYILTFALYTEREQTEQAYAASLAPDGITEPEVAFSARFGLLRWVAVAERFIEIWDRHESRPPWTRAWHRFRKPILERDGSSAAELLGLIHHQVAERLRSEYGYDVTDDGDLKSDLIRGERHKAANAEFLARYQPNVDESVAPSEE